MDTLQLDGYHLSFDDEFNSFNWKTGSNGGVWNTTYSYGERTLNDELEWYSDQTIGVNPFSLKSGALQITAAPSVDLQQSYGHQYTSGVITTYGSFAQEYGYFEMRAKLPLGQGLWPAFWMLPVAHVWPPEIDVLEGFGSEPNKIHWASHTSASSFSGSGAWVDVPTDVTNGYHTYGVLWTATTITYYFDKQEIAQVSTPSDMHQPMYMIANLAVGGSWPGNPFPSTVFPATMSIDYIRAYSADQSVPTAQMGVVSSPDAEAVEASAQHTTTSPTSSGIPISRLDSNTLSGTINNDLFQTYYGDTRTRAGGPGDDTYVLTDSRMFIAEAPNQGIDTVDAWMDYTLPPNVENLIAAAPWGLLLVGNSGSNFVIGGAGDDTISGGMGGHDILTGGGGNNCFIFQAGSDQVSITDFHAGDGAVRDTLMLDGFDVPLPEVIVSMLKQAGPNVVLSLDNGQSVSFLNAAVSQFTPKNFVISNVTSQPTASALERNQLTPPSDGPANVGGQNPNFKGEITGITVSVNRFFDKQNGTQFLTSSSSEISSIESNRPDLSPEGVAFGAWSTTDSVSDGVSVYRFFDVANGTHFFTANDGERDTILANNGRLVFEGVAFQERSHQFDNSVSVYRFFDTKDGSHFFTASAAERSNIDQLRPDLIDEGTAFYSPNTLV